MKSLTVMTRIESCIHIIRGQKVMLDSDLADLYGVRTKELNKAVKRNKDRFPNDFMFELTKGEMANLRFHFGTSKPGGRRYNPLVFTEQGVAMLSSVVSQKSLYIRHPREGGDPVFKLSVRKRWKH